MLSCSNGVGVDPPVFGAVSNDVVIPVFTGVASLLQLKENKMIDEYTGKKIVSPLDLT